MPILNIVTIDQKNPILRKKAHKIKNFDDAKLQKLIDDMVETMLAADGVGLAAPQIDVSQRIIVVRLPDDEDSKKEYGKDAGVLHIVINPELARTSDEMVEGVEGCLSIPGYLGTVDRHESVTVKGFDRHGKKIRIKAQGWLARVFQHEIDHLEGVLFIDEERRKEVWRLDDDDIPAETSESDDKTAPMPENTPTEA